MSRRSTSSRHAAAALLAAVLVLSLMPAATAQPAPNLQQAEQRLSTLEQDAALAVDRYEEAQAQLDELQQEAGAASRRVRLLEAKAREGREHVAEIASGLYRSAGQSELQWLLSAEGINDAGLRAGYVGAIQHAHTRTIERAAADQRALEADLAQLRESSEAAQATEAELGRLRAELESMAADQRREVSGIRDALARADAERLQAQQRTTAPSTRPGRTTGPSFGQSPRQAGPQAGLAPPAQSAPAPKGGAATAVQAAMSQMGKPYRWGGAGPNSYDCSGLMMWAYARAGISLPHSSRAQYAATTRVSRAALQPGDLVFFGSPIHHVGMYIGNGQMVEAPYSGQVVRVRSIARSDYVGAGRP
jgi:cell wall-associated NlpC family hydrolase